LDSQARWTTAHFIALDKLFKIASCPVQEVLAPEQLPVQRIVALMLAGLRRPHALKPADTRTAFFKKSLSHRESDLL
jgi:hypothetical protein